MLKIGNVTFDCANPAKVAAFWGEALGYTVQNVNEHFAMANHPENTLPNLLFIQVPEGRAVKNRMHMDVAADDRDAEIARLISLGATQGDTHSMPEYGLPGPSCRTPRATSSASAKRKSCKRTLGRVKPAGIASPGALTPQPLSLCAGEGRRASSGILKRIRNTNDGPPCPVLPSLAHRERGWG